MRQVVDFDMGGSVLASMARHWIAALPRRDVILRDNGWGRSGHA
jgi:hypothetical protein